MNTLKQADFLPIIKMSILNQQRDIDYNKMLTNAQHIKKIAVKASKKKIQENYQTMIEGMIEDRRKQKKESKNINKMIDRMNKQIEEMKHKKDMISEYTMENIMDSIGLTLEYMQTQETFLEEIIERISKGQQREILNAYNIYNFNYKKEIPLLKNLLIQETQKITQKMITNAIIQNKLEEEIKTKEKVIKINEEQDEKFKKILYERLQGSQGTRRKKKYRVGVNWEIDNIKIDKAIKIIHKEIEESLKMGNLALDQEQKTVLRKFMEQIEEPEEFWKEKKNKNQQEITVKLSQKQLTVKNIYESKLRKKDVDKQKQVEQELVLIAKDKITERIEGEQGQYLTQLQNKKKEEKIKVLDIFVIKANDNKHKRTTEALEKFLNKYKIQYRKKETNTIVDIRCFMRNEMDRKIFREQIKEWINRKRISNEEYMELIQWRRKNRNLENVIKKKERELKQLREKHQMLKD